MSDPFFTTNMPLRGKRDEGKPERVRVIRREDVAPRTLHSKFAPDPNAKPEQTRVLMSSDLRTMAENKRHLEVSAQRKAVMAKAAAEGKPEAKKPKRTYTRKPKAEKPRREARAAR